MIQVVYDKIVNFCGVTKIPCVIVGSKSDLHISYVVSFFFFFTKKKKEASLSFFPPRCFFSYFVFLPLCVVCSWRFFKKKKLSPYLSRQVDAKDGKSLAQLNDCAWIETSAKNNLNISEF